MRDIFISHLEGLLRAGDIRKSVEILRGWLAIAEPGEPEQMLAETSAAIRPKLVLLMRDLLSRYPSTIVGFPMLLVATPDFADEASTTWAPCLKLSAPPPGSAKPCEQLEFLGWLPADTQLPLALPFDQERYSIDVPWATPTSVVALFRSVPGLFELDEIELPNQWWGSLFLTVSANIRLSARSCWPYPDALEAARVQQAYIRGDVVPGGNFLSDSAWSLACDEAAIFKESCRYLHSDAAG
jgi:hypothetical protein